MVPFDSAQITATCNDDGTHQQAFPVRQVPTEILSKIFMLCLPDLYETNNYRHWPIKGGSLSMRVAPLQLCSICSRWRSVVLSTPRLWTLLKLSSRRINKNLIDCIHIWFSRAGTLPLTVQIIRGRAWGDSSVERLLRTLSQYASRWEFIQACLMPKFAVYNVWRGSADAPVLRSWHILDDDVGVPFGSAPLLKDVYMNYFEEHPSSVHSIPWHQLTVLKIVGGPSLSTAMEVMRFCPKLEILWIEVDTDDYDGDEVLPQVSRIEMAELRTLRLSSAINIHPLLESLVLPMLVDFSLDCNEGYMVPASPDFYKLLLDLFDRSKCKLSTLEFENCNLDSTRILGCLRHRSCTTITDLTIASLYNAAILTDEVFIQLKAAAQELLLPNLTKLTISRCIDKNVCPGLLGRMVLSRRDGQAESNKLESFTLTTQFRIHETDEMLLKKAQESGMTLDLHIITEIGDSESEGDDSEGEEYDDSDSNEEDTAYHTSSDEEETGSNEED